MTSYAQQRDPARNALGFTLVVLLHVLLLWALIDGLGHKAIHAIRDTHMTTIIPDQKRLTEPLPLPQPLRPVTVPKAYVPLPIMHSALPSSPNAPTAPTSATPQRTPPFKPVPAPIMQDTNVLPSAISGELPTYPEGALAEEIEGTATIKCDVGADGTTSNCSIARVTGDAQFGSTALEFVRTHKLHPATHDGLPVRTAGAIIPYKFTLTDAR